MNAEGTGTSPTVILIIDSPTAATLTAAKLQKLAAVVSVQRSTEPACLIVEAAKVASFDPLEVFNLLAEPKKRGRYWESDFNRQFGRRRK
ncbi:MAG: hypothetical protein WC329_01565 [Candidatus Omnitrophota bacterium]|jgi:hypothetical protein